MGWQLHEGFDDLPPVTGGQQREWNGKLRATVAGGAEEGREGRRREAGQEEDH
jgi:hypothetical protein